MKKNILLIFFAFFYLSVHAQNVPKNVYKKFSADYRMLPVSSVGFKSEAPIELINGYTNQAIGFIKLNPLNILDFPQGSVTINLASVKTGIELRDKYLRETYLETQKFPAATFTLKRIHSPSAVNLSEAKTITCMITGDMTLHGVTREITIPVTFVYTPENIAAKNELKGNLLTYSTEYTIRLSDYQIEIPAIRGDRISEEITIFAVIVSSDQPNTPQVK